MLTKNATDTAWKNLQAGMRKLETADHGIPRESASDEVIELWRVYESARKTEGAGRFTTEDRRILRRILTPTCCHITGDHEPTHYVEGRTVCELQREHAHRAATAALGLPQFTAGDCRPEPDCPHCNQKPTIVNEKRNAGGNLVICDEAARAVRTLVDKALAPYLEWTTSADHDRIRIVDNPANSFATLRALTPETRERWSNAPDDPMARIAKTLETIEEIEPVAWNEKMLRFEVGTMPGASSRERWGHGADTPRTTLIRRPRTGRKITNIELRGGRVHLSWPDEGPPGSTPRGR